MNEDPEDLYQAAYQVGFRDALSGKSRRTEPILHGGSSACLTDEQMDRVLAWSWGWQAGQKERFLRIRKSAYEDGRYACREGQGESTNPYQGWVKSNEIDDQQALCFRAWEKGWKNEADEIGKAIE
jgi:hypothetical protein